MWRCEVISFESLETVAMQGCFILPFVLKFNLVFRLLQGVLDAPLHPIWEPVVLSSEGDDIERMYADVSQKYTVQRLRLAAECSEVLGYEGKQHKKPKCAISSAGPSLIEITNSDYLV